MTTSFLVRTGIFAEVAWFDSALGLRLTAGDEVICRTERGLEVGLILAEGWQAAESEQVGSPAQISGRVLRPVNDQDRLLIERLDRFKLQAVESCEQLLAQRGIKATLVEAEQLFDGKHLFFYFLGDPTPETDEVLEELSQQYDRRIGFSRFAARLADGCGPGCGTTKSGCGESGGCSSCGTGGCGLKTALKKETAKEP
jgi:cell fate regulator YaaT (PSP1 superfamily)